MLIAFLSSSHEEWITSYSSAAESRQKLYIDLWLVRKSAADAFERGFFQVRAESHGVCLYLCIPPPFTDSSRLTLALRLSAGLNPP